MKELEFDREKVKIILLAALMAIDNAEWLGVVLGIHSIVIVKYASEFIVRLVARVGLDSGEIGLWLDQVKKNLQDPELKKGVVDDQVNDDR